MKGEDVDSATQLRLWVEGRSVHRIVPGVSGGECTPDFSCCRPELQATRDEREAYARSNRKDRAKMLGMFLGRILAGKKVYVAGTGGERSS